MKELIIVTGMSGAGKTQALNIYEDRGYFCIDNYPMALFKYIQDIYQSAEKREKIAVVVDIRDANVITDFINQLDILNKYKIKYRLIYLDARTDVLLSRYELSRRKHPLNKYEGLIDNIEAERKLISCFKQYAHQIIDTSKLDVKQLETELEAGDTKLDISLISFGFKNGIPLDAHLVFDVRFLPNPYYVKELRHKTGNDSEVYDYVMSFNESEVYYAMLYNMITYLIPEYEKEGKAYLKIAVGCSGGQHRSVSFINRLKKELSIKFNNKINKNHREVGNKKCL
ncbi:RNase adapter RapZ [Caviibacter abscessus]|uniref:RNase adapter RapZ n=1 Tax=Caviibacter abscessus TaxID=1766719 RepID=UPI00082F6E40|nr:RNase adapter RapZ [Caviibacter abscessus]